MATIHDKTPGGLSKVISARKRSDFATDFEVRRDFDELRCAFLDVSVAQLARKMGNTLQAVQRIANDLETEGVIAFRANPRHKRAQLIELTTRGRELYGRSMAIQRPWAAALGKDFTAARVNEVWATLEALLVALDRTASSSTEPTGTLAH